MSVMQEIELCPVGSSTGGTGKLECATVQEEFVLFYEFIFNL